MSPRVSVSMYQVTTSAQREEIRRCRREDGWSIEQIAREAKAQGFEDITIPVVKEICEGIANTKNPGRKGVSPERKAAIIEAVKAGATVREVAREFGTSTASIAVWTRGVEGKRSRGCPPPDPAKVDAVVAAYVRGDRIHDIQSAHNVDPASIYNYLARKGVPNNRTRGRIPSKRVTLGRVA